MKSPLVTIYITNYNYAHYIEKAIKSVIEQSFNDYEVLIIDDGSTDNSHEIIERYSNKPNIKIIYQKNKGLVVTNNIALRLSQGKYIMRLDADDYLDVNALKIMVSEMEKDDSLGLVFPNYFIVDQDENILNFRKRIASDENKVKDNPAHGACTLIRKKFLESIGGYDESYSCQDGYYLWVNFFTKFSVKNIETPLFYYRRHNSNLTNDSEKILTTRSNIISKFVKDNHGKINKAIAIIPVRGPNYNINSIALQKLDNNKTALDYKIQSALKSKLVEKIVITTPDQEIVDYVQKKYFDEVIVIKRHANLARFNSGLVDTVNDVFEKSPNLKRFSVFLTLSIRYPLLKSIYIDNAIKSMNLFETDCVVSVRVENSKFFKSSKNGLRPILDQDKFTKLEREDLYKYSGGLIVTKKDFFIRHQQFLGGNNGHVIIDNESSFKLEDESSKLYFKFIINNIKSKECK